MSGNSPTANAAPAACQRCLALACFRRSHAGETSFDSQFVDLMPEERDMQGDPPTIDCKGLISIAQYPDIREWCSHFGCTEI